MANLSIFKTTKRPQKGWNGALMRYLIGTEGNMSNIAQKKNWLQIMSWFLATCISILIYKSKQPFLVKKLHGDGAQNIFAANLATISSKKLSQPKFWTFLIKIHLLKLSNSSLNHHSLDLGYGVQNIFCCKWGKNI